jgi:SAM-dependent methyltransferase
MNSPSRVADITASQLFLALGKDYVSGRVLDLGCKNMPYKRLFPDCEWVGLDKRPVGDIIGDAHFCNGLDDDSFDTVICSNLLHKVESPTMVMKQVARVLKPGCFAVIMVPNTFMDDHKALFTITGRGMDYLIAASGLEGVTIVTEGKLFTNEWKEEFQGLSSEIQAWISKMDSRYPSITFAVARKPDKPCE